MADVHVDKDVIEKGIDWFKGHGPLPVIGDCPHACEHNGTSVIAWGPDNEHYCLVECDDRQRGCLCRGWSAEYPPGVGMPRMRTWGWKEVDRG